MRSSTTILTAAAVFLLGTAAAQEPLYIVNGEPREHIRNIPPDWIENAERLPADEETIARYGQRAANGVMIVTLCHDRTARFTGGRSFEEYIAARVDWPQDEPAARVILRYTVTAEGRVAVDKVLEATDKRLRRRVLKAVEEAPAWEPATKQGVPVASEGVLRIQLPAGKKIPREVEVVLR